ncbi:MAG: hypothetical protein LBR84_06485, partial [Tannerella sp.]|nr:hypothetical protein [Tannerella sp.]
MRRKASDNKYLHRDFHLSMNILLNYIYDRFGLDAVIRYLIQYTRSFHSPLHKQLKAGRMEALHCYIKDIYQKEEWPVKITCDENGIEIRQDACPGISHIKAMGGTPFPA